MCSALLGSWIKNEVNACVVRLIWLMDEERGKCMCSALLGSWIKNEVNACVVRLFWLMD